MTEETTTPVEGGAMPEIEVEAVEEVVETEEAEIEYDEEGNPVEAEPEIEEDDLEFEGYKGRVPKALKEAIEKGALRTADYTKKTQAVAEKAREVEARLEAVTQASESEIREQGRVFLLEEEISKYDNVDWQQEFARDAASAQAATNTLSQLKALRDSASQKLTEARNTRITQANEVTQSRLEEGRAQLDREVPDWKSPDKVKAIVDTGRNAYGFTEEEIKSETDPRIIRALHDLAKFRAADTTTKTAAKAKAAVSTIKPASKVKGAAPAKRTLAQLAQGDDMEAYRKSRLRQSSR